MALDPAKREEYALNGDFGEPPVWFEHAAPSGRPEEPDFPADLTPEEQEEVNAWKDTGAEANYEGAIAKIEEYEVYNFALRAWKAADSLARVSQWRLINVDAMADNAAAISPSAQASGEGGGTPPGPVVPILA
jgi:hypothetical protein